MTEKRAFIICGGDLVGYCETELKNGSEIKYGFDKVEESIHADIDYHLINARYAAISRNKKWEKEAKYGIEYFTLLDKNVDNWTFICPNPTY